MKVTNNYEIPATVSGDYIGKGSDNEPLIRNVSIVEKIKYREKIGRTDDANDLQTAVGDNRRSDD